MLLFQLYYCGLKYNRSFYLKQVAKHLLAFLLVIAGILHFTATESYMRIMPPWLPAHRFLVQLSGIMEIFLGGLLLFSSTQKWAAWGIILLLIAVFPANIQMTINYCYDNHPHFWLSVFRLPLQGLLIWWAYQYTK